MKPSRSKKNRDLAFLIGAKLMSNKIVYTDQDLKNDIYRFYIIRKMISRFLRSGKPINEKLLLNNIIIVNNIFGITGSNMILSIVCDDEEFCVVKSCMLFLNSYPFVDAIKTNETIDNILNDTTIRYNLNNN